MADVRNVLSLISVFELSRDILEGNHMANKLGSGLLTLVIGAVGGAGGALAVGRLQPSSMAPAQAAPAGAVPVEQDGHWTTPPEVIADLVQRVGPAVVNIDTVSKERNPFYSPQQYQMQDPFFGQMMPFGFFGMQQQSPYLVRKGIGSGFIISPDGLIVTNNHVVIGSTQLTVTLPDGKTYTGKVVGKDPGTDLALVKIPGQGLPTLPLANPKSLRVGQWVVAIGSPLGLQHTVTAGILSAMNRDVELNPRVGFLQTDAPINPGNSGGPLLNLEGQVIGVNSAVAKEAQGIGFAIPVSTLQAIIPQLEAHGSVERPWLGVGVKDLPDNTSTMFYPVSHGAMVAQVTPHSPASQIGLHQGDVILKVDGKPIHSASELIWAIGQHKVGDQVQLEVSRDGQTKTLTTTLQKMPDKLASQMEQAEQQQEEGN